MWRSWVQSTLCTFSSLKSTSAEVDIGIIAACVPTLLPLYRLIRDKSSAVYQTSSFGAGRFPKLFLGRSSKTSTTSQKPLWRAHEGEPAFTPRPDEWKDSLSHPFKRIERAGSEDVEMGGGVVKVDRSLEVRRDGNVENGTRGLGD